jgi:hypothetical protein
MSNPLNYSPYDEEDDPLSMQDCVYLGKHLSDAALAYMHALKVRDFELDREIGCGSGSYEERFEEMVELLRMTV